MSRPMTLLLVAAFLTVPAAASAAALRFQILDEIRIDWATYSGLPSLPIVSVSASSGPWTDVWRVGVVHIDLFGLEETAAGSGRWNACESWWGVGISCEEYSGVYVTAPSDVRVGTPTIGCLQGAKLQVYNRDQVLFEVPYYQIYLVGYSCGGIDVVKVFQDAN